MEFWTYTKHKIEISIIVTTEYLGLFLHEITMFNQGHMRPVRFHTLDLYLKCNSKQVKEVQERLLSKTFLFYN